MRKFIIIVTLFLLNLSNYSQEITNNSFTYFATACDNTKEIKKINNRIIDLTYSNDTLKIKIGIVTNCANHDKGSVIIQKDSIILNSFSDSNELVDCDCYFEMDYIISPVLFSGQKIYYETSLLTASSDLFLTKFKNGLLTQDNNGFSYNWSFYETNKLKTIIIEKNQFREIIEFYENGFIKKNIQQFFEFGFVISKTWNENGEFLDYKNSVIDDYYELKFGKK